MYCETQYRNQLYIKYLSLKRVKLRKKQIERLELTIKELGRELAEVEIV